jgi:DNA-binding MarR family transcriptional regulator
MIHGERNLMSSQFPRNLIVGLSFLLLTWGVIGVALSGPDVHSFTLAAQEASSPLTPDYVTIDAAVSAVLLNFTTAWHDFAMTWARIGTLGYGTFVETSAFNVGVLIAVFGTISMERSREKRPLRLRDRILDEVAANPGVHLRELHRSIGCAMGALQYHLRILESDGQVTSLRNGNVRHLFSADFSAEERVQLLMAMARNPTVSSILSECSRNGQTTQADISRTLDIDKSLVSYYVGSLLDAGILNSVKVFGREKPVILTDWARTAIDSMDVLVQ